PRGAGDRRLTGTDQQAEGRSPHAPVGVVERSLGVVQCRGVDRALTTGGGEAGGAVHGARVGHGSLPPTASTIPPMATVARNANSRPVATIRTARRANTHGFSSSRATRLAACVAG